MKNKKIMLLLIIGAICIVFYYGMSRISQHKVVVVTEHDVQCSNTNIIALVNLKYNDLLLRANKIFICNSNNLPVMPSDINDFIQIAFDEATKGIIIPNDFNVVIKIINEQVAKWNNITTFTGVQALHLPLPPTFNCSTKAPSKMCLSALCHSSQNKASDIIYRNQEENIIP
jgi:hypothetical protein